MTKCGKSFLPECEYFATNGCVSPFNCPYKIENESITTATSTPCNHYPLETDKDKEISRLQAEVAELRARLDKAGAVPCFVGDTLYEPFAGLTVREWTVDSIYANCDGTNIACHIKDCDKQRDILRINEFYNDFEGAFYLAREAAEARLKEMKEEI